MRWNHSDLSGCAPRVGCWLGGYLETGTESSMTDRLKELKSLFDDGLITEDEYEEARKKVLSGA